MKPKEDKMFEIKKLTNCGNIDYNQNPNTILWGTKSLKNIKHKRLSKLRDLINAYICLLYTSPSPRDGLLSRMPSSA